MLHFNLTVDEPIMSFNRVRNELYMENESTIHCADSRVRRLLRDTLLVLGAELKLPKRGDDAIVLADTSVCHFECRVPEEFYLTRGSLRCTISNSCFEEEEVLSYKHTTEPPELNQIINDLSE